MKDSDMNNSWVACSHDARTSPRPRKDFAASCEHVGAGEGMPPSVSKEFRP